MIKWPCARKLTKFNWPRLIRHTSVNQKHFQRSLIPSPWIPHTWVRRKRLQISIYSPALTTLHTMRTIESTLMSKLYFHKKARRSAPINDLCRKERVWYSLLKNENFSKGSKDRKNFVWEYCEGVKNVRRYNWNWWGYRYVRKNGLCGTLTR